MRKRNKLVNLMSVLAVVLASQLMVGNAFATEGYRNTARDTYMIPMLGTNGCLTCHKTDSTSGQGSSTLKNTQCVTDFHTNHDFAALKVCLSPTAVPSPSPSPSPAASPSPSPAASPSPSPAASPSPAPSPTPCGTVGDDDEGDDESSTTSCDKEYSKSGSVGSTKSGRARTDVYQVTCAAGATALTASVIDLAPVKAPTISIQLAKGTATSPLSKDPVDGNTAYSAPTTLAKGAGIYSMKINKSASTVKGAESYTAKYSCVGSTSSKIVLKQNQ
jgi:hypothetical protein